MTQHLMAYKNTCLLFMVGPVGQLGCSWLRLPADSTCRFRTAVCVSHLKTQAEESAPKSAPKSAPWSDAQQCN